MNYNRKEKIFDLEGCDLGCNWIWLKKTDFMSAYNFFEDDFFFMTIFLNCTHLKDDAYFLNILEECVLRFFVCCQVKENKMMWDFWSPSTALKFQIGIPFHLVHSKKMKIFLQVGIKNQEEPGLVWTNKQVLWLSSPTILLSQGMASQEENLFVTFYPRILLSKKMMLELSMKR